jgi:ABC-type polysaccharide/polyol phosphate transport system ATPase subunit
MAQIVFDNVGVCFEVRRHGRTSLKDYVVRGLFRKRVNPRITVRALNGVSFTVREGDRLGVIGHNGAGKSTLLKTIAGVYRPTGGHIEICGRIHSLFDVSAGFEPDGTGWENIAYRSYLQGETPRTVGQRLQSIAEFSELGEHLDMPIRYYSAGMIVRLGFAIATSFDPEILVVDEILSAGDCSFQKKARLRMEAMIRQASVVVLSSHDLPALAELCDRIAWMDHGALRMIGPPETVIAAYSESAAAVVARAA